MNVLTGGVGAHVDDLAFGPADEVVVGGGELGFDHDGVLGPGLQRHDDETRLVLAFALGVTLGRLHVCDRPAVRATGVLAVILRHVLIRTEQENRRC